MISDEEIDAALLANITDQSRKLAFVLGVTMMRFDGAQCAGRNDLYFAKRVAVLVEKGLIEPSGNLDQIRQCEVRLHRN